MTSVLIVDDDQQLRAAVVRDLVHRGFDVSSVSSVHDAIEKLTSKSVDVVLTDLRMDDRDGLDLILALSSIAPRTRSILMSAFATARDHQKAMELGAVQVLCKPFTSNELLKAIQQAVECERGFHGSVHGLSLVDILQMFHYSRRSVSVTVGGSTRAEIHIKKGEIVHALHGDDVGELALQRILAMPSGSVQTNVYSCSDASIQRTFQSLLLDVLRELDEENKDHDSDRITFDLIDNLDQVPGSASAPETRASVERACELALRAIEGCIACAVIELSTGSVLGHQPPTGSNSRDNESFASSVRHLFRSDEIRRLEEVLSKTGLPEGPILTEVKLHLRDHYYLAKTVGEPRVVVVVAIPDRYNPGLSWAQLKTTLAVFEAAL